MSAVAHVVELCTVAAPETSASAVAEPATERRATAVVEPIDPTPTTAVPAGLVIVKAMVANLVAFDTPASTEVPAVVWLRVRRKRGLNAPNTPVRPDA